MSQRQQSQPQGQPQSRPQSAQQGQPMPQQARPQSAQQGQPIPQQGQPVPQQVRPQQGQPAPQQVRPQQGQPIPQQGQPIPQQGQPIPQQGQAPRPAQPQPQQPIQQGQVPRPQQQVGQPQPIPQQGQAPRPPLPPQQGQAPRPPQQPQSAAGGAAGGAPPRPLQKAEMRYPSTEIMMKGMRLALQHDKPLIFSFWGDSLNKTVFFNHDSKLNEWNLYKSDDEFTSPILNRHAEKGDLICETENSMYVIAGDIGNKSVQIKY